MLSIRSTLAVLALSAATAVAGGQARASNDAPAPSPHAISYAVGTQRYHLNTLLHRDQPLGGGRAPFDYSVTTDTWVAITLAAQSTDTLKMTVTVDSMAITSTVDLPKPDLAKLRGAKLVGTISPTGRVYAFDPPKENTSNEVAALYGAFRTFLIPLSGKPLQTGATWADTVVNQQRRANLDITSSAVSTYKVSGDTTIAGRHAWRVDRTTYISQQGKGTEAGQPLTMSGSASVKGSHYLTDDGVFVGATSTQRSDINMKMNESEGAPIQQTFKSTVELLPAR